MYRGRRIEANKFNCFPSCSDSLKEDFFLTQMRSKIFLDLKKPKPTNTKLWFPKLVTLFFF